MRTANTPLKAPSPDPPPSNTERYILALQRLGEPFATPAGARFFRYPYGDGCSCTVPLKHPGIRNRAAAIFRDEKCEPPGESAIRSGFRHLQALAPNDTHDVHLRIGAESSPSAGGVIHIDPAYTAAPLAGMHFKVDAAGWRLEPNSLDTVLPLTAAPFPDLGIAPGRFRRDNPAHSIPDPMAALDDLRRLLRLESNQAAWLAVLTWLLTALRPQPAPDLPRDYPILEISGPASSGKTAAARILRTLVDPCTAPINSTPSSESAAGRLARENHVIFLDGLTQLPRRPAELLARLSTGIAVNFHGDPQNTSRPILLTINEPGAAQRLQSRTLRVELPPLEIPLPLTELHARFEAIRARTTAALLTLLSNALRCRPGTSLPENTRFPEAAQWLLAATTNAADSLPQPPPDTSAAVPNSSAPSPPTSVIRRPPCTLEVWRLPSICVPVADSA